MHNTETISFSIIICTYNPHEGTFQRLLNSILQFDNYFLNHEVIIVDNNSSYPLDQNESVRAFLTRKQDAKLIKETIPGLTYARIAGIEHAKHDWIIFFDDDNEPAADYLHEGSKIILENPQVGAWGPGIVNVEYPNMYYEKKFHAINEIFQIRQEQVPRISNNKWWQDCYPAGTGLIIRKDVTELYAQNVSNGIYCMTDRKRKQLSSGGDLQMVLSAIKMGFNAGVHPNLRLNHLIAKHKLSIRYLNKLAFATAASNVPGHLQVWGDSVEQQFYPPSSKIILSQIYFHLKVKLLNDGFLKTSISCSAFLGALQALYQLNPTVKISIWWKLMCRVLQVK